VCHSNEEDDDTDVDETEAAVDMGIIDDGSMVDGVAKATGSV
jgi:hypothetical protein